MKFFRDLHKTYPVKLMQGIFNGSKSAEEVSGGVNKRVQMYLDERK